MPLVTITGIPCSGKSTVAQTIKDHVDKMGKKSIIICEDEVIKSNFSEDKNVLLNDSKREKTLRSDLKGQVIRDLSKDTVVILDGLNYIKGFRYELYCASKTVKTTQITVHCDISPHTAWSWNKSRSDDDNAKWTKETFDALVMRYEAPIGTNRWDAPLFLALEAIPLNMESVEAALFDRKPPPPNQSTQCQPLSSTNFLQELDRSTSTIIAAILEAQKLGLAEDVKVPGTDERINATRKVNMAELARTKRQFITYAKARAIEDVSKLSTMFVQYLNTTLF